MSYLLRSKLLALILLALVLDGCGYKATTTQTRDTAFLKFSVTNSNNYIVTVNSAHKFKLKACVNGEEATPCGNANEDVLYEVSSGQLLIVVTDDHGNLIMERNMYVGSGNTVEVSW